MPKYYISSNCNAIINLDQITFICPYNHADKAMKYSVVFVHGKELCISQTDLDNIKAILSLD
jgi:hypothetical protein